MNNLFFYLFSLYALGWTSMYCYNNRIQLRLRSLLISLNLMKEKLTTSLMFRSERKLSKSFCLFMTLHAHFDLNIRWKNISLTRSINFLCVQVTQLYSIITFINTYFQIEVPQELFYCENSQTLAIEFLLLLQKKWFPISTQSSLSFLSQHLEGSVQIVIKQSKTIKHLPTIIWYIKLKNTRTYN